MNFFHPATSGSALALSSILASVDHDMNRSILVFSVLVGIAAFAWLLTLAVLAGAWKKVSPLLPRKISVGSVSGAAIIVMCGLLLVVYTQETRRHPARPAPIAKVAVSRPAQESPHTTAPSHGRKQVSSVKSGQGAEAPSVQPVTTGKTDLIKPAAPVQPATMVASNRDKSSPPLAPRRKRGPSARNVDVARKLPSTAQSSNLAMTAPAPPRTPAISLGKKAEASEPFRKTITAAETPSRKGTGNHGRKLLSEPQSRQLCGEISVFPGTEVYIKWSPKTAAGSNPEELANQLSKVMDCARIVVTFSAEQPGLGGHGVQVATHAEEGETSDRIRPFADAIAAALREQGFNVAEVSGPDIPANQTAIFIGSD